MKKDWIIHIVPDEVTGLLSGHTHGLDKWGSFEIEINLHLRPEILGQYLNLVAERIVKGLKIEDGERIEGIFNCPIYFFKTKSVQSEDLVLRAIFPDEFGFYPWDLYNDKRCELDYKEQIKFKTFKVWYLVLDFISDEEKQEYKFSLDKGAFFIQFKVDIIDGLKVTTMPYKYLTSKAELFTIGLINSANESSQLAFMQNGFAPNKITVYCKDGTAEQIKELQDAVHLRDDEL